MPTVNLKRTLATAQKKTWQHMAIFGWFLDFGPYANIGNFFWMLSQHSDF